MNKPPLNIFPSRLVIVAGLLASLVLTGCDAPAVAEQEHPPVVLVASAATATAPETRATGLVVSRASYVIASEPGGRILRLHADVGDSVRRGQELAVLDPQPMRLQRIQAEAELRRAEQVASERTAAAVRADIQRLTTEAAAIDAEADVTRAWIDAHLALGGGWRDVVNPAPLR